MRRTPYLFAVAACLNLAGCYSGSPGLGSVTVSGPRSEMALSGDFALNEPTAHQRVEVSIRIEEREKQPQPQVELSKGGDPMSTRQAQCMQWLCLYFADMKADRFYGAENLRKIRTEIHEGLSRDVYSRSGNWLIQEVYLTRAAVTAPSSR